VASTAIKIRAHLIAGIPLTQVRHETVDFSDFEAPDTRK
jgi:hypothetical protein